MNPLTQFRAQEHALAEYPNESCGFIIVERGKQRYVPCQNKSDNPNMSFVIGKEDWADAEDRGEIIAIVHSHPDQAAIMSDGDLVQCAKSELPWYVISVAEGPTIHDVKRFEPAGYDAPLVGRTFSHGILDCYSLVRDYYARELGIELPDFERQDEWWHKGQDLYMQHFADAGCSKVEGELQIGDIIIMQVRAPVANHAAVYIGDGQMLHHMYNRLSTRETYAGYYQEITRVIVRHKDMQS